MDASPSGRISSELSNWTGKAYKIPRNKISDCKNISEIHDEGSVGVYILMGNGDVNRKQAYIGETENIYKRLNEHVRKKEFWNEAIVIISKDENLNKAHIKYLEHRMIEEAKFVDRYDLTNSDFPKKPSISKPDQDEMEEFFIHLKLLVSTFGYKIFDSIIEAIPDKETNTDNDTSDIFYLEDTKGAYAEGVISNEGFVVFENAKFVKESTPTIPTNSKSIREQLITDKILQLKNGFYILNKKHLFSSSSSAASAIKGNSSSGPREWKLKNGKSLKEYEKEQLGPQT